MGQDQLIKAVEEESRRESARIVKEAEAEAGEIISEAKKAVEKERLERLEGFRKELEKERIGVVNRSRAGARSRLLAERSGLIEEIFSEVVNRVEDLPQKKRLELVQSFYDEVKKTWQEDGENPGDKPRVHINPADLDLIKDPEVEFVPDAQVSLGVVFVSGDARLRAENTLSARLNRARGGLVPQLNRILLEE